MNAHLRSWFCMVTAVATLGTFAGCGNNGEGIAKVKGRVTIGSEPLANVKLEFNPVEAGRMSVGFTDTQGEYELQYNLQDKGALVGKHIVNIRVYPEPGTDAINIPPDFQDLERDVLAGTNEFNFDIP